MHMKRCITIISIIILITLPSLITPTSSQPNRDVFKVYGIILGEIPLFRIGPNLKVFPPIYYNHYYIVKVEMADPPISYSKIIVELPFKIVMLRPIIVGGNVSAAKTPLIIEPVKLYISAIVEYRDIKVKLPYMPYPIFKASSVRIGYPRGWVYGETPVSNKLTTLIVYDNRSYYPQGVYPVKLPFITRYFPRRLELAGTLSSRETLGILISLGKTNVGFKELYVNVSEGLISITGATVEYNEVLNYKALVQIAGLQPRLYSVKVSIEGVMSIEWQGEIEVTA